MPASGGAGHPVGAIHPRIGGERLVVQRLRERLLEDRHADLARHRVEQRRDHQPAEPDLMPEQAHDADDRMLAREELQQRVGKDDDAE
jgi:hypothetical protein